VEHGDIMLAVVGTFVCTLLGKIIFDWLSNGKGKKVAVRQCKDCSEFRIMANKIDWLTDWHKKTDADGTPLGYTPKTEIVKLQEQAAESNTVLKQILEQLKLNYKVFSKG